MQRFYSWGYSIVAVFCTGVAFVYDTIIAPLLSLIDKTPPRELAALQAQVSTPAELGRDETRAFRSRRVERLQDRGRWSELGVPLAA